MELLRRRDLPNFYKLPYKVDINELQKKTIELMDINWNALSNSGAYGKLLNKGLPEEFVGSFDFDPENSNLSNYQQLAFSFGLVPKYKNERIQKYIDESQNMMEEKTFDQNWWEKNIFSIFKSPITRARLALMKPHSKIKPHIDYDTTYSIRVHIPIFTNSDVKFFMQRPNEESPTEYYLPADGSVWFMNQGIKHSVVNYSNESRIHLVLSINGQEDLNELHSIR